MLNIITFLFFAVLGILAWNLIKPEHFRFIHSEKKVPSRKKTGLVFGLTAVALFFAIGVFAPPTQKNDAAKSIQTTQSASKSASQDKPAKPKELIETKKITETKPVAYQTVYQDDAALTKGQTRVVQYGSNGSETYTYSVTYRNGIEQSRVLDSKTITTQPVNHIIANGTYVEPPTPTYSSSGSGYTNSQGNYVPSPSSDPTDASAQCVDGTYSYSQTRRGTCSHHGGVARWL